MIVRETRKIDEKGRVTLPISIVKALGLGGEVVYFEVTKNGNLMIKKVNKTEKTTSLPDNDIQIDLFSIEKEN